MTGTGTGASGLSYFFHLLGGYTILSKAMISWDARSKKCLNAVLCRIKKQVLFDDVTRMLNAPLERVLTDQNMLLEVKISKRQEKASSHSELKATLTGSTAVGAIFG